MKVTYLGTTMLLFDDGEDQILFDCHVTRPSIPKYALGKLETDKAVADRVIKEFGIHRLKAMFISHSHHDHVMDAPYFSNVCGAKIYGTESTLNVARGGDVPEDRLTLFKENESYTVGKFKITVLKSLHSKPSFFNNDLGQTIDEPLKQPVKKKLYKEGGSYDFYIEHEDKKILIRPSYNYIAGQLDNIKADVLFLAIAGLAKDEAKHKEEFFKETIEKVEPKVVIPLHWDNFFTPLYSPIVGLPKMFEFTGKSMHELAYNCAKRKASCIVQMPLTTMDI